MLFIGWAARRTGRCTETVRPRVIACRITETIRDTDGIARRITESVRDTDGSNADNRHGKLPNFFTANTIDRPPASGVHTLALRHRRECIRSGADAARGSARDCRIRPYVVLKLRVERER